jgi:DMSO/TMAO reductase YedYZ heme-binding membrane subunit
VAFTQPPLPRIILHRRLRWQALFIAVLFTLYSPYYWEELHKTSDLILRVASYVFLIAMTITSFFPVRRRLRTEHWH